MPFLKPFSGQIILLFSKYSSSQLNIILVNNLLKQLQLNSDITAEEMMKAVKYLKNKKVSGLVMR
jgi:hypothetical protein